MTTRRVRRLPVRVRLVAAFIGVMLLVLTAAGAFVYWRVQIGLDKALNAELDAEASSVQTAWRSRPDPALAVAGLPPGALGQVLDSTGRPLAATPAASGLALLRARDVDGARTTVVGVTEGNVLTSGNKRLRVLALPLERAVGQSAGIAVVGVRLGTRDETLRELLAQLSAANLLALLAASLVGHRLARAALRPVERYRARAEQIAEGATGVRLDVPPDVDDEVSRLGHTLNRMLTVQEQTAEQQRQFLADASHELRAPLTVLSSEVELALRRPRTNEEYEQTLHQVAVDTARLVALADQLLDLEHASRIDANRDEGAAATAGSVGADATAAAHRAAARARVLIGEAADRTVSVSAPPGPLPVAVPELDLDQILTNLVSNAVVHGAGPMTVTVAVANGAVTVTVSDNGPGPPPEFIPQAVERFRRADPARTTPGDGLGLALVHALISRAGGELRLCTTGTHHRYPPLLFQGITCQHPDGGTHAAVIVSAGPG